jgi:hypothetical protein
VGHVGLLVFAVLLAPGAPPVRAADLVVARDDFSRSVSNGWGSALTGGAYSLQGPSGDFRVDGSAGVMRLTAGANRAAALTPVLARDVDVSFRVATDKVAAGAPVYVYSAARRISASSAYWLKLTLGTDGSVWLHASRHVANTEQGIGSAVRVSGLTHKAGTFIRLRSQVTGASPTTIRLRAWADGEAEPTGWIYTATDSTTALQVAGAVDVRAYLGSKASNAPLNVRFDDYLVTSPTTTQPPADQAVLVGAGDIAACDRTVDSATATLLDAIPGTVFAAGDTVTEGTASQFTNCYKPTWGRHKARTKPALGNREYRVSGAVPYFDYFGAAAGERGKGWYAFNIGAWRVYMLNSNCSIVGCGAGSAQEKWLRQDLAANPKQCAAAIMHHPRFTSSYGADGSVRALWQALYDYRADIVISGHAHNYERFALQNPAGSADPGRGIRQFVVGTGGHDLYGYTRSAPNSQIRNANTHGVIKLTLRASAYDWEFIPVPGKTFRDSGTANCV